MVSGPHTLGCSVLRHWQHSLPVATMSQSWSLLRADLYLKCYAQLHWSLHKNPCFSSFLLLLFYTNSSIFSLFLSLSLRSWLFLSFPGHCVSLQSLSCCEHAQLAHFMRLTLQLSYAFPTFDQFDHLLLCSRSQMAGCYRQGESTWWPRCGFQL